MANVKNPGPVEVGREEFVYVSRHSKASDTAGSRVVTMSSGLTYSLGCAFCCVGGLSWCGGPSRFRYVPSLFQI